MGVCAKRLRNFENYMFVMLSCRISVSVKISRYRRSSPGMENFTSPIFKASHKLHLDVPEASSERLLYVQHYLTKFKANRRFRPGERLCNDPLCLKRDDQSAKTSLRFLTDLWLNTPTLASINGRRYRRASESVWLCELSLASGTKPSKPRHTVLFQSCWTCV